MLKAFTIALFISSALVSVMSDKDADRVTPASSYPYKGETYSGYLDLKKPGKALHYMFNPSQKNPLKDPLVLWLNGGPGCSSLLGWAVEHGPARFQDLFFTFKWIKNEYSWNKVANMIYLESPAGVGYSYATDKADLKSNDLLSAEENLQALLQFFERFPEYKENEFYITGESYAGIYVPRLAQQILKYNSDTSSFKINLKGIAVGNGVTDWTYDTEPAFYDLAYTHFLYPVDERKEYEEHCINNKNRDKCLNVKEEIQKNFINLNIYDLYKECGLRWGTPRKTTHLRTLNKNYEPFNYTPWLFKNSLNDKLKSSPTCLEFTNLQKYFNEQVVKERFHIHQDTNWTPCSDTLEYTIDPSGSLKVYPELINAGLRILIYSGDTDGAVPINGSLYWINELKIPIVEKYRQWFVNDQLAGYTQIYKGLQFVSVLGTGHMVPQWAPAEALHLFQTFLEKTDI